MRLHIEKLVFGGQGLGRTPEGQVVFVWNALPGEDVEAHVIEKKKNYIEAVATEITNPSPDRVPPKESHYLSSSPWQMMTYEAEVRWKRAIAAETYSKIGSLIIQPNELQLVDDPTRQYGYRNKIEFSFCELPDGTISLAFFERGAWKRKPADGSLLAESEINTTAKQILAWVNDQKIPMRSLKTVIVRSDHAGHTIAALFIKDELTFTDYPVVSDTLVGFHLYYSTHKSPASVPTKLLYSTGPNFLMTTLHDIKLHYGLLSFFQINVPLFERALSDIGSFLHPTMPVVDFYSGVGAISLPLSKNRDQTVLVDSNREAIDYANENIALNQLKNAEAHCLPSENLTDVISDGTMVILDPPRAGLHSRVVSRLLTKRPPRIFYLSCDLATHARDLRLLSEGYKISFLRLYNFFPRTPHIEGLAILDQV